MPKGPNTAVEEVKAENKIVPREIPLTCVIGLVLKATFTRGFEELVSRELGSG
jgi:hypothetical protein